MFDGVIGIFTQIAIWIVVLAVSVSLIFLAIGIARGTIEAQWANQLGSSMGLNAAYTRIIMTIVLAAVGLGVPVLITTIGAGLVEAAGAITVSIPAVEVGIGD